METSSGIRVKIESTKITLNSAWNFSAMIFALLDSSKLVLKTAQIAIIFRLGNILRSNAKHKVESMPLLRETTIVSSPLGIDFEIDFSSNLSVFIPFGSEVFGKKFLHRTGGIGGFLGVYLIVKKSRITDLSIFKAKLI
jgi:hypothetical protein